MDEWLAINRGDDIPWRGRDQTIHARIHANANRQLYPTSAGHRIYGIRERTREEERELGVILLILARRYEQERAEARAGNTLE